jgi:NADH pyrophosphatase NudC (nudix superfamily)
MRIDLSKIFKHCPHCGAKGPRTYSKDKHIKCDKCGFVYFHNVASAVGAIIEYKSKVLVITRANEPKAGMLDFPGGFADYGEPIEETLTREIREELGIKIKDPRYLISAPNIYIYKGVTYTTTDLFFTCRIDEPKKIKPDKKEVAGIEFFEPEEIPLDKLAFISAPKALRYYIKQHRKSR